MKSKSIITTILALAVIASLAYAALKTAKPDDSDNGKYEGWKTYRNEKYGYEVKYPKGLIPEQPYGEGIAQFVKAKAEIYYSIVISDLSSGLVLVDGKPRSVARLDLKTQIVLNLKQRCKKADLETITWNSTRISDIEALQASTSADKCLSKYLPWTSMIKNNLIYHIKFTRGSKEEYNKLLSSFRLIEIPKE